jgi:uroporphyrinogen III methyltransferase / synthase
VEHLAGKRILLTRAEDDQAPWLERLISLGAEGVCYPCISIEPLELDDDWPRHLDRSDWIAFTSFRSVTYFAEILEGKSLSSQLIAAVGPATEAAVVARFGRCDLTAPLGTASSLADALTPKLTESSCVLMPGAAEPRSELATALSGVGATAQALPLYTTRPRARGASHVDFRSAGLDAALFASPSALNGALATALLPDDLPIACIGPSTAAAAASAELKNIYISESRDLDGLLRALKTPLSKH